MAAADASSSFGYNGTAFIVMEMMDTQESRVTDRWLEMGSCKKVDTRQVSVRRRLYHVACSVEHAIVRRGRAVKIPLQGHELIIDKDRHRQWTCTRNNVAMTASA